MAPAVSTRSDDETSSQATSLELTNETPAHVSEIRTKKRRDARLGEELGIERTEVKIHHRARACDRPPAPDMERSRQAIASPLPKVHGSIATGQIIYAGFGVKPGPGPLTLRLAPKDQLMFPKVADLCGLHAPVGACGA